MASTSLVRSLEQRSSGEVCRKDTPLRQVCTQTWQEKQQGTFLQPCITRRSEAQVSSSLWQHGSISSYRMINVLNATDKRLVAWRVTRFITVKLGWGTEIFRLKMLLGMILTWLITPCVCLLLVGNETFIKTSSSESGNWCLKRNIN